MTGQKTILVAPLNWGLGHATRCIPLIGSLIKNGFVPLLATDGPALELLKKEFPKLEYIELPSYHITYAKNANFFKLKLLGEIPKMLRAIKREKMIVKELVQTGKIQGIISDNRLGVHHKGVASVFITHQLNVLTGNTTWLSTFIHNSIIKKYNECWVPDREGPDNLSGRLGHLTNKPANIKYIGVLSRFKKLQCEKKYDILVLLSGPEPQRTLLEEKLLNELQDKDKKILFVMGKVEKEQKHFTRNEMEVYNFMSSDQLELAINESELILCRSGYTTIMDLAVLEKKAFFIPTPGQYEQEYLAARLRTMGVVPCCKQNKFTYDKLNSVPLFRGLYINNNPKDFSELFELFQCK